MSFKEIIEKHFGQIIFYPFCGDDFDFISNYRSHNVRSGNVLYIYCTIISEAEYDLIDGNKKHGLHTTVCNIENKLGLNSIKIFHKPIKLEETNCGKMHATLYKLDDSGNNKLIFIFGEVYTFVDYLKSLKIPLFKINSVMKFCGKTPFSLLDEFHPPISCGLDKFIISGNSPWATNIKEHYKTNGIYQLSEEFSSNCEVIYYDQRGIDPDKKRDGPILWHIIE